MQNLTVALTEQVSSLESGLWRRRKQRLLVAMQVLLLVLPLVIFSLDVYRNAADAPYFDDYAAILDFMNRFLQTDSPLSRLAMIFSQHNEHRIVPTRLAAILQYYAFGEINFRNLIILGAASWVAAVGVLVLGLKKHYKLPLAYLVVIPYFMASALHHENRLYAMVAIQNYGIILFSLLFLFAIAARKTLAYNTFFAIALYTSGGGIILYPLGNFVIFMKRRWRPFLAFFAISSILTAAYFYHFQRPASLPPLPQALTSFEQTMAWFVAFLGSGTGSMQLALPVGLVTAILLLAILMTRGEDDPLFLIAAYVLLTAATTTLSRVSLGPDVAIRSAYAMYSLLAWVCIYIFAMTLIRDETTAQRAVLATLAVGVVFFSGFFLKYELTKAFSTWRVDRTTSLIRFTLGDRDVLIAPSQDKAAQALEESRRLGVFNYAKFYNPVPPVQLALGALPMGNEPLQYFIDELTVAYARGWAFMGDVDSAVSTISLVLSDDQQAFLVPAKMSQRHDVSTHFNKLNEYDNSGFEVILPVDQIPARSYKIGFLIQNGDASLLKWTDKILDTTTTVR